MNFFTNRFVAEWLEGLGGLALLAKEEGLTQAREIHSTLTEKTP